MPTSCGRHLKKTDAIAQVRALPSAQASPRPSVTEVDSTSKEKRIQASQQLLGPKAQLTRGRATRE